MNKISMININNLYMVARLYGLRKTHFFADISLPFAEFRFKQKIINNLFTIKNL